MNRHRRNDVNTRNQGLTKRSHQAGFVLPMVIFLIVILAGAAVAISQLTIDNTQSNVQALQKTRADLFNQSLVDIAVYELVTGGQCPAYAEETLADNPEPQTHPDFPSLTAILLCKEDSYSSPSSGNFALWTITSTTSSTDLATNNEEYVWRRERATVELEL